MYHQETSITFTDITAIPEKLLKQCSYFFLSFFFWTQINKFLILLLSRRSHRRRRRRRRRRHRRLFADADNAAGESSAGVARGETELVAALAEVVDVGVDDHRASDDGQWAGQRDGGVGNLDHGDAVGASLDVAEVAGVADLVGRRAVRLAVGVEVAAGRGAAVGVVAELVDVEAVKSFGQPAQFSLDGDGGADVGLGEVNRALDHFSR